MSKVAVVIVGFRCADDIVACLKNLESVSAPEFEVHLCENGGEKSFQTQIGALAASTKMAGIVFMYIRRPGTLVTLAESMLS